MAKNKRLSIDTRPTEPTAGASWSWRIIHRDGGESGESAELVWKWIPPGRFRMGARGYYADEEPVHEVDVRRGYWMLETPVTQRQWLAVEGGENPSYHKTEPEWREHPVERVTWPMACAWRLKLEGLIAEEEGLNLRVSLPNEAEWEYACRAGSVGEYYNGDGEERLSEVGWYAGNSKGKTHPVKQKNPNPWGLYDMHGNVFEWCRDPWNNAAYGLRDDGWFVETTMDGDENPPLVLRGGSCANRAVDCRSAFRGRGLPGLGVDDGFRACLFPGPP